MRKVIYTSPVGGGRVLQTYLKETAEHVDNFAAAKILADKKGYAVELLGVSNVQGMKSADALINGELWEIKTNQAGAFESISGRLKEAKKQSPHVILKLKGEVAEEVWQSAVFYRFNRIDPKSRSFVLQKIIVITKSNDVLTFTRDEVLKWADKRSRIL